MGDRLTTRGSTAARPSSSYFSLSSSCVENKGSLKEVTQPEAVSSIRPTEVEEGRSKIERGKNSRLHFAFRPNWHDTQHMELFVRSVLFYLNFELKMWSRPSLKSANFGSIR